jgi:hypothetical protein
VEVTACVRARTHEEAREEVCVKVLVVVTAACEKVRRAVAAAWVRAEGSGWRWAGGVVVASGEEVASETP